MITPHQGTEDVPESDWIYTFAPAVAFPEIVEHARQLRLAEQQAAAARTAIQAARIRIGGITYYWSKALAGTAASALFGLQLQSITKSLTGQTTRNKKRKRTALCSSLCMSILNAAYEDIENIMQHRSLETEDRTQRLRKKFTSRATK